MRNTPGRRVSWLARPAVVVVPIAVVAFLATACAATARPVDSLQLLQQEIRDRGLDPGGVVLPYELTEDMRLWARDVAPPKLSNQQKLQRLAEALLDPESLRLEYAWGHTGTAAEVFEHRQANCLAFTNLFLGMAREVGVPVHFLSVKDVATYRKNEDLVVVSDHVAVGYGRRRELLVYDFSEQQSEKTPERLRRIPDLTAVAMFYSNRGAEVLQQGRAKEAIEWLETAVELDPELPNAWVNLGVSRRRIGDFGGAEQAYKRTLEIDPRILSAYQNLASLLYTMGRGQEARGYEETLRRSPSRNPYTFLALGDISFQNGRLTEARRFYRRASHLSSEAESYAALGEVAAARGDLRTARKMLRKARKRDLENERVARLAATIETSRS
ncbi:MAG: tetratricopeptide repeat protein [bacterium]|nr:tetratricopeptide repeat protein [bacterium]